MQGCSGSISISEAEGGFFLLKKSAVQGARIPPGCGDPASGGMLRGAHLRPDAHCGSSAVTTGHGAGVRAAGGVEPHSQRFAGSFCFNAFIDCDVHVRM